MTPAEVRQEIITIECPACGRWHATVETNKDLPCWWCRRGVRFSPYTDGVDRHPPARKNETP